MKERLKKQVCPIDAKPLVPEASADDDFSSNEASRDLPAGNDAATESAVEKKLGAPAVSSDDAAKGDVDMDAAPA